MPRKATVPVTLALSATIVAGSFSACGPAHYARDADAQVNDLLAETEREVLGDREATVERPAPPPPGEVGPPLEAPPATTSGPTRVLELKDALRDAVKGNREYQTRREGVYLQGLGVTLARYDFGPIFSSAVSTLWTDTKNQPRSLLAQGDLSVSQILATGGKLSLGAALGHTTLSGEDSANGDEGFSSAGSVNLTQPLLRGAGYMVSHEPLTQAERDLVYAIRDFELFREQFSINIASSFWNLVSQKWQLVNAEENARNFRRLREQSEAMRRVGRNSEQDVFTARRQELQAENELVGTQQNYHTALDRFKIDLGLSTEVTIQLAEEIPQPTPLAIPEQEAIAIALANRLDLSTERQRVEDAERAVVIAENGLLPDLDLTASHQVNGGLSSSFTEALPDDRTTAVGLRLQIPIERTVERNSYRATLIRRDQSERNYSLLVDSTGLQIRNDLRELDRIVKEIAIQNDTVKSEEKALAITRKRYENGTLGSRDVTEAQQGLLSARNSLIQLHVDHAVARLNLLRDTGLLFVDAEGMWRE